MTEQELYDEFFADEEYDLEKVSAYEYSYWSGWNNGLKRAAIILRNKIRPEGKWIDRMTDKGYVECPFCHKQITGGDLNFCVKCGAAMRKGDEEC